MKQKLKVDKPTGTFPNKPKEKIEWDWRNEYLKDLDMKSNYLKKKDLM
jgi:hypothetical protein